MEEVHRTCVAGAFRVVDLTVARPVPRVRPQEQDGVVLRIASTHPHAGLPAPELAPVEPRRHPARGAVRGTADGHLRPVHRYLARPTQALAGVADRVVDPPPRRIGRADVVELVAGDRRSPAVHLGRLRALLGRDCLRRDDQAGSLPAGASRAWKPRQPGPSASSLEHLAATRVLLLTGGVRRMSTTRRGPASLWSSGSTRWVTRVGRRVLSLKQIAPRDPFDCRSGSGVAAHAPATRGTCRFISEHRTPLAHGS